MMIQRTVQTVTVATLMGVMALLGACGSDDSVVSSANVSTGNTLATIEVYSDAGNSAHASAQLIRADSSSGDRYLDLRAGDALWFTNAENLREASFDDDWFNSLADISQAQELLEGDYRYRRSLTEIFFGSNLTPDQVHYNGRLAKVHGRERYTVSLLRESGLDALGSSVEMPASFDILAPTAQLQLSRSADPLIVEWFPSEPELSIELEVSTVCAQEMDYQYRTTFQSDEGYAEIEPGEFDAHWLSGECSTSVTVSKVQAGQLDSAYAGGSITARQVRSVTFTTVD